MTSHAPHHEHVQHPVHPADRGEVSTGHGGHDHDMGSPTSMAISATLHCLTGCAIGEIAGLIIGTAAGIGNAGTIAISIALAFLFGYSLSTLPLLKSGLAPRMALTVVLAADTLSILTMEVVDNAVVAVIPGAMNAGLVNVIFWVSMMLSLAVAFVAAVPVNRYLLQHGKGHALTHQYHGASTDASGRRRFIPAFGTGALAAVIVAFMLGGLLVSIADELGNTGNSASGQSETRHE
ncbi:MAG: DUF4396 domain-containing protein [Pseudonocardiales bacterium]